MDKRTIEVVEKIKKLIQELENDNIKVDEAYLYGSYARGDYHNYSDIDVAIISKSFQGIRYLDYISLGKYVLAVDSSIEPMPFRPEDFNDNSIIYHEIKKHGIRIV